jgi:hypothetical protein
MGHTIPRTYFGHCPKKFLREGIQRLTGCTIERAYVDKGYRGYDAPDPNPFYSGCCVGPRKRFRLLLPEVVCRVPCILTSLEESLAADRMRADSELTDVGEGACDSQHCWKPLGGALHDT